jgi:hypothetical protein
LLHPPRLPEDCAWALHEKYNTISIDYIIF